MARHNLEKQYLKTLSLYEWLNIDLKVREDHTEAVGTCPFCNHGDGRKPDHFYVNLETGQWDCKVCKETGNKFTFMTRYAQSRFEKMRPRDWNELAKLRKNMPTAIFKPHRMFKADDDRWMFPAFNPEGTYVNALYEYHNNEDIRIGPDMKHQLLGAEYLVKVPSGTEVWVAEGHWDFMTGQWLMEQTQTNILVVGVPGAGTFKQEWIPWFRHKRLRLIFDNDKSGDDGAERTGNMLKRDVRELQYLWWPEMKPSGFDLDDAIRDAYFRGQHPAMTIKDITKLFKSAHRRAAEQNPEILKQPDKTKPSLPPPTFEDVWKLFQKYAYTNDNMRDSLILILAICISNNVPGIPLWLYLVGPAGCGKTMLLAATKTSPRVSFHSSVTPQALVSGWNNNKVDPSLLPRLNGLTAIFKDGTEILALDDREKKKVYSRLRGAFDGHYHYEYGHGVVRDEEIHFNLLIGVTPAIHADNNAAMGERFLRIEIREQQAEVEEKVLRAMRKTLVSDENMAKLQEMCSRFLEKELDSEKLPAIPPEIESRLVAASIFLSYMRAQVEREKFGDRDILYRPTVEHATRIGEQLTKLGRVVAAVLGKKQVDVDVYRLLKRVVMESAVGFHLEIFKIVLATGQTGLSVNEFAQKTGLTSSLLKVRLDDMTQLGVLEKFRGKLDPKSRGVVPSRWRISGSMMNLWDRCKVHGALIGSTKIKPSLTTSTKLNYNTAFPPEKGSNGKTHTSPVPVRLTTLLPPEIRDDMIN